jgi:Starch-binding associating with outer membrane
MKSTKTIIISILLISFVFINACELEEANISPNSPTEAPVNVLMPFNQERIGARMSGSTQVMAGIFMQYYEGIGQHPVTVQSYTVNEALYVEWEWDAYYTGPMENIQQMINRATEDSLYYYSGIGKVMMALCLGNLSSMWGDIPYSDALLGSGNLSPIYNSQESIYETIQELLDEAIDELQIDYSGKKPNNDDILYNGDANAWIQAAYALKARYYLHLTKREAQLGYNPSQEALNALTNAFTSSSNDLEYKYGFSTTEENPFYSFSLSNYIVPNEFFIDLLDNLNDPRDSYLFTSQFGQVNIGGGYYTQPSSPVPYITYYELKFIEAEARLRLNISDPEAQNALQEAVRENMLKISEGNISDTEISDYLAANTILSGNFDADLQTIISQKYIALFSSIESWTDYRRTGYPLLTPNDGGDHNQNPGGEIPRRLPYCQTERLYNTNVPNPLPTLQDRFWWDVE